LGIGTSLARHALHFVTPRMLQIWQMKVPQLAHG
jgi:hypothetical protein